ncbi:unnamed protein product [Closterium sp. NIES-53]
MEPHRLLASLSKPSDRLFLLRVEDDILRFLSCPWGSAPPDNPFIPRNSFPVSANACASSSRSGAPSSPELIAAEQSPEQAGRAGSAQGGEGALARRRVRPGAEPWTRGRSARAKGEAGEGSGRLVVTVESDKATGGAEKKIRAEIEARVGARPGEGEARKEDGEAGGVAAQEGAGEAERKVSCGSGNGVDGEAELRKGQYEGGLAERTGGTEGSGGDVGAREINGEAERGESDLEEGVESWEEGAGSEGEKQGFQKRVCKGRGFKAHQGGGAWAAAAAADARIAAGQQGTACRKGQTGQLAVEANGTKAGSSRKSWEGTARGEYSAAEENPAERFVEGVTTGVVLAGGVTTGGVTTGGVTVTDVTEMGREGRARCASDAMLVFPKLRSYHRLLVHSAAKRFRLSSSSYPLWGNTGYKHVCCSLTKEQLVSRPALGDQAGSCTLWCSFVPPLMLCDFIPGGRSREQTLERAAKACPVPKRFLLPVTVAGVGKGEVQGGREWERRGGGMDESTQEQRGGGGGKDDEPAESKGDEVSLVPKRKGRGRFLYHEKEESSEVEKFKERSGKGRGEERSEGMRGGEDWGAGTREDGRGRGFGEHWRGEKGKEEEGWWEKGRWDGERGGGGGGNRGWNRRGGEGGEARDRWHTKGREGSEKRGSERGGEGKGCRIEESSTGLTAAEMVTLTEENFGADEGLDGVIITRASHDYRMWQAEEEKSRGVDEGDRVRVPRGVAEGSHGLPVGAQEDCRSGEELAAAGTRHILVVRAEVDEVERAIEKITEMVMGSVTGTMGQDGENQGASVSLSATVADSDDAATVIGRECSSAAADASAATAVGAHAGVQMLHHSPEPPPYESLPVVLVRRAVQVTTRLHPSVRAVPVAAAEQIGGAGKEAEGEEREEAAEAAGAQGTDRGVATTGTFLVIFASAEMAGTAEWRIRKARRWAGKSVERRRAGSEDDSSSSSRVSRDQRTGERLEGCADGCLEKDVDERLVGAVACCLSVSRFEDASADVLASCYWSVPERRKTRVDGAAAARLLSRSLV